jgi:hypothetical protein
MRADGHNKTFDRPFFAVSGHSGYSAALNFHTECLFDKHSHILQDHQLVLCTTALIKLSLGSYGTANRHVVSALTQFIGISYTCLNLIVITNRRYFGSVVIFLILGY